MDKLLLAASVAVPLLVALVGAIWFLVASSRGNQHEHEATGHAFRGQGEAVTVAELLEEAIERGDGIRLNWPVDDVDTVGQAQPHMQNEFPTVILPSVENLD